jgi:hypothetical protein
MYTKIAVKILFIAAGLLLCYPFSSGADIYTWVDGDGVHHFGNERPVDPGVKVRIFVRAASFERPSTPVPASPGPELSAEAAEPLPGQHRLALEADESTSASALSAEADTLSPAYDSRPVQDASPSREPEEFWNVPQSRLPADSDRRVIGNYQHHDSPRYREYRHRLRHRFHTVPRERPHRRSSADFNAFTYQRGKRHHHKDYSSADANGRQSITRSNHLTVHYRFLPMLPPQGQYLNRPRSRAASP